MITLVSGARVVISWQASMPDPPGRRMSITTTSGRWARVRSTASRAVAASATTSKPGWRSSSERRPSRTTS